METGYDANKKNCCECKCEDCFEDEVIKLETGWPTKLAAAIILLSSFAVFAFAVMYILGG